MPLADVFPTQPGGSYLVNVQRSSSAFSTQIGLLDHLLSQLDEVLARIGLVLPGELLGKVVDQRLVEVDPAELVVMVVTRIVYMPPRIATAASERVPSISVTRRIRSCGLSFSHNSSPATYVKHTPA